MAAGIFALGIILSSCEEESLYPAGDTVVIGTQTWTTINLAVDTFRNGDPIPEVSSEADWVAAAREEKPAWCYYGNDPHNGQLYGRLYNYFAIVDPRGLAPEGWHVSSDSDWNILIDYLGGAFAASGKLKSRRLWAEQGGNNDSGFSALPGSFRHPQGAFVSGPNGPGYASAFWARSGRYILLQSAAVGYSSDPFVGGSLGAYVRLVKTSSAPSVIWIGDQLWGDANLDVDTFRNGEPIPHAPTVTAWATAANERQPAWCYYGNDPDNGRLYGRLYNWYAVTDPRGLAPQGMHIPDVSEWNALAQYLLDNGLDGGALKSIGGWDAPHAGADNFTGFTALPGQMRFAEGFFYEGPQLALFWSTEAINAENASARGLHGQVNNFSVFSHLMGAGLSVRYIANN